MNIHRDEIITEPEANNCFKYKYTVIISKKRKKKTFQREITFIYSGKTATGSHFVRRGDYRLIINNYWMRLSMLAIIIKAKVCVELSSAMTKLIKLLVSVSGDVNSACIKLLSVGMTSILHI